MDDLGRDVEKARALVSIDLPGLMAAAMPSGMPTPMAVRVEISTRAMVETVAFHSPMFSIRPSPSEVRASVPHFLA